MAELAVIIPPESTLAVFSTAQGLDPFLQQIRAELDKFKPDITSVSGRAAIASIAYKVAKARSALDKMGKELADEQKEIPKKIDAERKRMRDLLEQWQDEVRKPLTDWEEADRARIAAHEKRLVDIAALSANLDGLTSEQIKERRHQLSAIEIGDHLQEFKGKTTDLRAASLATIDRAEATAIHREAEAAELKRLRDEAAARLRRENEERIAREAAEQARKQAEAEAERQRHAAEAQARAEREAIERAAREAQEAADRKIAEEQKARLAAIRKAEQDAESARQREAELERQRKQAEADAKAAEERAAKAEKEAKAKAERELAAKQAAAAEELRKREADKAHRGKINRAAVAALIEHAGLTDEQAKAVVTAIAGKKIPAVAINY